MSDIEYFYSAHSLYAYSGSARLTEITEAAGRRIAHRPIDLNKVMEGIGTTPFSSRSKAHSAYFSDARRSTGPNFAMRQLCRIFPSTTATIRPW